MAGANCPQTPRQKLIGMMYLFLTAMLAINVSDKVLYAFIEIDKSLSETKYILSEKNQELYRAIATQSATDIEYEALNEQAKELERKTNEAIDRIERLKRILIAESNRERLENFEYNSYDDINKINDITTPYSVMGEMGRGYGDTLINWINEYREFVLGYINEEDKGSPIYESIYSSFSTEDIITPDGTTMPWHSKVSGSGIPLMATISMLTKIETDVKNVEGDILNYLIMGIEGGVDIRITSLEGLVSSSQGFVIRGGEYRANIFLGARDSTMDPLVYIRNQPPYWKTELNEAGDTIYKLLDGNPLQNYDTIQSREGYARYTASAASVGDNEYGGLIMYQTRRGAEYYPFIGNYTVGDAGFTVSATNCAVFYRGLDNPTDVAVSGYPQENVRVSISGGARIRRVGRAYMVSVPQSVTADAVRVNVSVVTEDGVRNLGGQEFRILNVPPPSILLGGAYRDGATVPRAAVTANPFLGARLESDFFPFEGVSYTVTRFDFLYSVRGVTNRATVNGSRFSPEVLDQINRMGAGQALSFSNIFVEGPSGVRQTQGINVILR